MARVSRPLSDAELAKEEKVERARAVQRSLEDAADAQLESMAERGEPESREVLVRLRRMLNEGGLEATATALGAVNGGVVEQPAAEQAATPPRPVSVPKRDTRGDEDRARRLAFGLMKENWKKWKITAKRNGFESAFRDLAMDLGDDGVQFVEAGLFADMNDLIQCIQRCLVQGKVDKNDDSEVDYRGDIEKMKAELRGEK